MIKVMFHPEMSAPSGGYSPSAEKPRLFVRRVSEAFDRQVRLVPCRAIEREKLYVVHDKGYVDGVLAGRIENGHGNKDLKLAQTLLYTSGSMLDAAIEAHTMRSIVCSPTSGFHHAGRASGGGFCTFNGLAAAAAALAQTGVRVGILDCDYHYGNGTTEILQSLAGLPIFHFTAGNEFTSAKQATKFLGEFLPTTLEAFADLACDVVLYQAGADAHVDDPLGGFLTTEQLAARDTMVFAMLQYARIGVAFCLAGGYQKDKAGTIDPVLRIHENTVRAALALGA